MRLNFSYKVVKLVRGRNGVSPVSNTEEFTQIQPHPNPKPSLTDVDSTLGALSRIQVPVS